MLHQHLMGQGLWCRRLQVTTLQGIRPVYEHIGTNASPPCLLGPFIKEGQRNLGHGNPGRIRSHSKSTLESAVTGLLATISVASSGVCHTASLAQGARGRREMLPKWWLPMNGDFWSCDKNVPPKHISFKHLYRGAIAWLPHFHCQSSTMRLEPDALFQKKRFYLFIFREGEGREKEERNIDVRKKPRLVAPGMSRKKHWLVAFGCGDQTPQPGLCPDWESNQ